MIKTFNGHPLKAALIHGFNFLPPQELANIKNDLGLTLSVEQLMALQKSVSQPGGGITTDELYMADAFARSLYEFSDKYSFSEIRTDSPDMQEAFSDIMDKRNSLGFSLPINHNSLMDVYSKYLICTGYDNEKIRPKTDYRFFEKHSSFALKDSGYHAFPPYIGCEESDTLIAPSDCRYRFNTNKEKIFELPGNVNYHLLLVKLDGSALAFEALAEILHGNAHLSKDIAYCAPVGKRGLIHALLDTGHGYHINLEAISALFERALNPFDLAYPMNCAIILAPAEIAQSIAMTVFNFGYTVRFVGYTTKKKNAFSVFFQNIYHTLNADIFKKILPEYVSCVTLSSLPSPDSLIKTYKIKSNLSLSVFYGITFDKAYETVKNEVEKLHSEFPDQRVYAYLTMPIVTAPQKSNHNVTIPELLGIYKALAEYAIPMVNYDFVPSKFPANASLLLFCEDK